MDSDEQGTDLAAPGAALLLIIGEPFSEDHKTQILAEITKGFRCWDVEDTGININDELAQIANKAKLGEEGTSGDRFIQHQSDNLAVEILINPLSQSVKNALKKLLIAPAPVKYVIYAGHAFQESGAWVLQDDTFAFSSMAQVFKNAEVESALKQNIEASLTIHTLADSNWGQSISHADFTNNLRIQLNPPEKLDNIHGVLQFTAYVGSFVKVVPITSLLQASEQFGNISFTRPTLYIFPGCQGDSALFGINGFNLLVDGGYNRRACFWDFARHLDRVDAMLLSHLDADNIFSINTVLQRKNMENIHPQIGYLYFNAPEKMVQAAIDESGDAPSEKNPTLLVKLSEEATKLTKMAKQLGISPHPCSRGATAQTAEPINLYHKLGHGSLDMYPLNPITDSKEMKEFYQHWSKQSSSLGSSGPFPLQNAMSVCTLIVWKPYNNNEKIVRILFPGNAPQHKIAEGLEKMKEFRFLKIASCTGKDLVKPPPTKKASTRPGSSANAARLSSRTTASSRAEKSMTTSRSESSRKTDTKSSTRTDVKTNLSSPSKSSRPVREDTKKPLRTNEEKDKQTKMQSSTGRPKSATTSPTKSSAPKKSPSPPKPSSPAKSPSPPKMSSPAKAKTPASPKSASPAKSKSPSKTPSPEKVVPTKDGPTSEVKTTTIDSSTIEEIPAAVPEPSINQNDLKPESDQIGSIQLGQGDGMINTSNEVSPPKEAWVHQSETQSPFVEPAKGIFNSNAFTANDENQKMGGTFGEQTSNGLDGPVHSNMDHYEIDEDEIKPQALPDPPSIIIESPSIESDGMPDYSSKIEADELELSDFSRAEADVSDEQCPNFKDPAQEIPSSPEPTQEENTNYSYPSSNIDPPSSFVFNNDGPESDSTQPSMEHNIQYGIDNSNGRAMGGIQEEDEEETEEDNAYQQGGNMAVEKSAFRDTGVDEEYDMDEKEELNAFEKDDFGDEEIQKSSASSTFSNEDDNQEIVEKQDYQEKDYIEEDDVEIKSDNRLSAERQFEDVEDDGIQNGKGIASKPIHDTDKDASELLPQGINGNGYYGQNNFEENTPNTFIGLDDANENDPKYSHESHPFEIDSDDEMGSRSSQSFDPVAQWGQPMGLPSPPPFGESGRGATSPQKSRATDKRPASASTKSDSRTSKSGAAARPGTAPTKSSTSRLGTGSKKPSSSRSSPPGPKIPPLPPMTPFYVDLTYIPNHGDPAYCNIEFFKRVRARYYVLSSLSPNPKVLDCLMEAKETWEDKNLEVTLIPTYDNETLRHWMGLNKEKLQELHMDMTPAVSRCTIQLQDLETSLPAYRLEV